MGFRNPLTTLSASLITPGTLPAGVVLPASQVGAGALDLLVIARALANGTVTGPAIAAGAVTAAKIAADTITAAQIAAGAIGVVELAAGAVTAAKIDAGAVTAVKIAANAVTADKVDARAISAQKVGVGVLATNLIANPAFEDTGEAFPTLGVHYVPVPGWSPKAPVGDSWAALCYRIGNQPAATGSGDMVTTTTSAGQPGVAAVSDPFPVRAGASYRAGVSVAPFAGSIGLVVGAVLYFYDAAGAYISAPTVGAGALAAGYVAFATTIVAPAGATTARLGMGCGTGPSAAMHYADWDLAFCIEIGSPAVEVTPAGIRMWDKFGAETITINGEMAVLGAGVLIALSGAKVYGDLDVTGDTTLAGGVHTYVVNSDTTLVAAAAPVTTSGANTFLSPAGEIQRVSSLRRFKLDREPIGVHPELLDLPAMTWRDAAEVEADPDTTHRVPGFVAEDVQDVSAAHGGSLEPLLTRDEDGALQGLAYDRIVAYLLPIVAELRERVLTLEGSAR